jgi:hypothetical protein
MQWLVRKGGYSKRRAHCELVRSFLRLINRGRLNHVRGSMFATCTYRCLVTGLPAMGDRKTLSRLSSVVFVG